MTSEFVECECMFCHLEIATDSGIRKIVGIRISIIILWFDFVFQFWSLVMNKLVESCLHEIKSNRHNAIVLSNSRVMLKKIDVDNIHKMKIIHLENFICKSDVIKIMDTTYYRISDEIKKRLSRTRKNPWTGYLRLSKKSFKIEFKFDRIISMLCCILRQRFFFWKVFKT